jgi:hypothetical protein
MKDYKLMLFGILGFIGMISIWVLIFTTPFWLVWNCIISAKFGLPTFTFSESFFVILIIKWLFGVADLKQIKDNLTK